MITKHRTTPIKPSPPTKPLTHVDAAMALNLSGNLSGNPDMLNVCKAVKVLLAPSPENTPLTHTALLKTFHCADCFVGVQNFLYAQEKQQGIAPLKLAKIG